MAALIGGVPMCRLACVGIYLPMYMFHTVLSYSH